MSAGARPDRHWGEREVFHGDFSIDESQLGGKVMVFKVRTQTTFTYSMLKLKLSPVNENLFF